MPATDTEIGEVEKVFAVNVFGAMRMLRVFHPLLIEARGTMVNIGSVGGVVPYVYGCEFGAFPDEGWRMGGLMGWDSGV